jgi:2-hydroxychromene-2-carboxylate isomerase
MLLGATFQVAELKSPVSYPLKREYSLRDFERSARFEGVPFKLPAEFPIPTINAARLFWWLDATDPARAVAWAHTGLRAYFTRGVMLSDPVALKRLASEFDLDPLKAEAAWNDPQVKARLKAVNDEAIRLGIFGAPYFSIDGEPFWGNDRKPQIERWLAEGRF